MGCIILNLSKLLQDLPRLAASRFFDLLHQGFMEEALLIEFACITITFGVKGIPIPN
jgi:hypothetical protein